MGRYKCKICDDKIACRVINEEIGRRLSGAAIARLMTLRGFAVNAQTVNEHAKHMPAAEVPPNVAKGPRDLAVMVRDLTADAVENGDLSITDPMWKNVQPGLKAQALLDNRANKTDDRKIAIVLALRMAGKLAPADVRLIEDGNTVEGEYTEVSHG